MTTEEIARRAKAAISSEASLPLVAQWVAERYRQFVRKDHMRHLRSVGTLHLPANISAGSLTATRGSRTIVGDATALAAWTASIVGRHIRVKVAWYEIIAYDGNGNITLEVEYGEETTSTSGYQLAKRYHDLPSDVRHTGSFVLMRRHRELTIVNMDRLSTIAPARWDATSGPRYAAETGRSLSGARRYEFYPYCGPTDEVLHYISWAVPPVLGMHDEIPVAVDTEMLKEGVLIDLYRWEASREARKGNAEVAAFLRNEARTQLTQWNNTDIPEAMMAERGVVDDCQFLIDRMGGEFTDITDARTHVLVGGS